MQLLHYVQLNSEYFAKIFLIQNSKTSVCFLDFPSFEMAFSYLTSSNDAQYLYLMCIYQQGSTGLKSNYYSTYASCQ